METVPESVDAVRRGLTEHDYLADEGLSTSIFLALRLRRPLLLEGEAGVGKTEVAKVLAEWTGGELLRLQCYEGIDASQAVYEWDYARQLLHLRALEASGARIAEDELYSERFLVQRPLLRALAHDSAIPPVLLIDEVDRADDEFEAFLLEMLSDWTITVPELGAVHADVPPVVVLTSNRTRDVHDALKRRCLYHWIPHPDFERELAILRLRAPEVQGPLAREVAGAVEVLRDLQLYKPPGVAETIDWAQSLATLGAIRLDERTVDAHLGTVLKYHEDQDPRAARTVSPSWSRAASSARMNMEPDRLAVAFARVLRGAGLDVPVGSTIGLARALEVSAWRRRAACTGRAERHWCEDPRTSRPTTRLSLSSGGTAARPTPSTIATSVRDRSAWRTTTNWHPRRRHSYRGHRPSVTVRWSPVEVLRDRDFACYTPGELARRVVSWPTFASRRPRRPSRRRKPTSRSHGPPDLRRTVRRSCAREVRSSHRRFTRPVLAPDRWWCSST